MPSFSAEDQEMVKAASHKLLMETPALVNNVPLYAVAALAMALAHAAVLAGESYEDVAELFAIHFKQTSVTELQLDAEEAGVTLTLAPPPKGKPS